MKEIAIFGAGGFGREIACIINQVNQVNLSWKLIGFFDDGVEKNTCNEYGKILGSVEDLNQWPKPLSVVFAIGNPKTLKVVVDKVVNPLVDFPNIIAPNVYMYDMNSLKMGKGNVICPNSVISCNIRMGDFNLLNVFTQIGHDSELGDYNIIMPSVNISGGIKMGNGNLLGVKSTILQYKKVGDGVTIAPGSVLTRNAKDGKVYLGNPAKIFM